MSRSGIEGFSRSFVYLHVERRRLAGSYNDIALYASVKSSNGLWPASAATLLVRSAAVVEQMINGVTVRLWDDPFEWTLPERLPTASHLICYFEEVEAARLRGFEFLTDDDDLALSIPAPEVLKTLGQIFHDAIVRSENHLLEAKSIISNSLDRM